MASNNESYWSRSWALLTRDEGWFKPLLVLAAAQFVPVAGPFGTDGYALEWARLTSWGVDSSPKQKGVDVGACIKSGARAFVIALGYGAAIVMLRGLLTSIFGESFGGLLAAVVSVMGMVLVAIAKLRGTIYQRIGAGYQLNRIADMVKRDYKGLLRICGMCALFALAIAGIVAMMMAVVLLSRFGDIVNAMVEYDTYGYVDDWYIVSSVLSGIAAALPLMFVFWYLLNILTVFSNLMINTAVGLWMRQFDVQNWGESSDPLPGAAPTSSDNDDYDRAGAYSQPTESPSNADAADYADVSATSAQPVVAPASIYDDVKADEWNATTPATPEDIDDEREALDSLNRFDITEPENADQPATHDETPEVPTFNLVAEEEAEPEVATFELASEPETEAEPEVATFELVPETIEEDEPFSEEDVLADVTEAIQAADLSAREKAEEEVKTFTLRVPGEDQDNAGTASESGSRVTEVTDLSGGFDDQLGAEDE